MDKQMLLLDIPVFKPNYEVGVNYCISTTKGKENLKKVLLQSSNEHCMYCYTKVIVDEKERFNLEHSIEKNNSEKLKKCPSNISIACTTCNCSCKRKGEAKRALTLQEIKDFEASVACSKTCISICDKYDELKYTYLKKEDAHIILQPSGVINKVTKNPYIIQYDILNQVFISSTKYNYNKDDEIFIKNHINRFNLNDSRYRTKEIIKVCEDVTDNNKIPRKDRYNNLIANIFIDKLETIEIQDAIKLCNVIKTMSNARHKY